MVEQTTQPTTKVSFTNPQTQKVFESVKGIQETGVPPSNESVISGIQQAKQSLQASNQMLSREGQLIQRDSLALLDLIESLILERNKDEKMQKFLWHFRNFTQRNSSMVGRELAQTARRGRHGGMGVSGDDLTQAVYGLRDFVVQLVRSNEFRELFFEFFNYLQFLSGKKLSEHEHGTSGVGMQSGIGQSGVYSAHELECPICRQLSMQGVPPSNVPSSGISSSSQQGLLGQQQGLGTQQGFVGQQGIRQEPQSLQGYIQPQQQGLVGQQGISSQEPQSLQGYTQPTSQQGLGTQQSMVGQQGLGQQGLSNVPISSGISSQQGLGQQGMMGQQGLVGQQGFAGDQGSDIEDRLIDRYVSLTKRFARDPESQNALMGLFSIFQSSRGFFMQEVAGTGKERFSTIKNDSDYTSMLNYAKLIIMEFCDQTIFEQWMKYNNSFYYHMNEDKEFRRVIKDFLNDFRKYSREPELLKSPQEKQLLKQRLRNIRYKFQEKKNMELTDAWITSSRMLLQSFRQDEMNAEMKERTKSLISRLFLDEQGNFQLKPEAFGQIRTILIVAIQEAINNWSALEITGDDGTQSYKLSNIVLSAADILPDDVKFKIKSATKLDYGEERHLKHFGGQTTSFSVKLFGMTAHLKDVFFDIDRRSFPKISDRGVMDIDFDRGGIITKLRMKARLDHKYPFYLDNVDVFVDKLHIKFKEAEKHKLLLKMASPFVQTRVRKQIHDNLHRALETNIRDMLERLNYLIYRSRATTEHEAGHKHVLKNNRWRDASQFGYAKRKDRVGEHSRKTGPHISETKLEKEGIREYHEPKEQGGHVHEYRPVDPNIRSSYNEPSYREHHHGSTFNEPTYREPQYGTSGGYGSTQSTFNQPSYEQKRSGDYDRVGEHSRPTGPRISETKLEKEGAREYEK
ncbi:hypothetical protein ABK040_000207 [Willaertia magna]